METESVMSCRVSPDKLSANLILKPQVDPLHNLTCGEIKNELKRIGVSYGIEEAILEGAVEFYNEYKDEEDVIIAKGQPPKHGKAGKAGYLVKRPQMNVAINSDGSMNFREVNTITRISKGQPVYHVLPPVPGVDGMDVYGKPIKAREYDQTQLPVIKNTEKNPAKPNQLVSTLDGCVVFKENSIELTKYHIIRGNVDFSSGNVRFDGPIKVTGDVKAGFEVHSKGCIEIDGTVEDALITTDGDVCVKGGFVGTGKGAIRAKGDVRLRFVRNQSVEAGESIIVAKEALDCKLSARRKIYVAGKGLGLAGGYAFAIEGMELSALGSETEVKTEIQVGSDPKIKDAIDALMSEIEQFNTKSVLLQKQLMEIEMAKKKSKNLFERLIEKMEKVMEVKMTLDMKIEELKKKKLMLEQDMPVCLQPIVRIQGETYPGVLMSFHSFKRIISEKKHRKMYYLEKGDIRDTVTSGANPSELIKSA